MAITEAEVKRLLAEIRGKKLITARLGSIERLRGFLADTRVDTRADSRPTSTISSWSSSNQSSQSRPPPGLAIGKNAQRAAADGLMALVLDRDQPADVRERCADVLDQQFGRALFKEWAMHFDWPAAWTDRLLAIVACRDAPESARTLAVYTLEARALEEGPGFEAQLTPVLASELAEPEANSARVRLSCLEALVDMHRSNPDWLANVRKEWRTSSLPSWDRWRLLSNEEKTLAAILADPRELDNAIDSAVEGAEIEILEAVEHHTRYDASTARALTVHVRKMIPIARTIDRGAFFEVVGVIAQKRHHDLLRAAINYDRAKGTLDLSWVNESIYQATLAASQLALALVVQETNAPNGANDESLVSPYVRLWIEIFRDGARGLADRLKQTVTATRQLGPDVPAAWIGLRVVGDAAALKEATRHALEVVRRGSAAAFAPTRVDVLVAMVAPEHVLELQEARVLESVEVPTEQQSANAYRDEAISLPRRVRLKHLALVLEEGTDQDRMGPSIALVPAVVRWLPTELVRFEPLLRKYFGSGRSIHKHKRSLLPPAASEATGKRAFDAWLAMLDEIRLLSIERRPLSVERHIEASLIDMLKAIYTHGHRLSAAMAALRELVTVDVEPARAFLANIVRDPKVDAVKRLDAWTALDTMGMGMNAAEDVALLEEILQRENEPELGPYLVPAYFRDHRERFEQLRMKGALQLAMPRAEHLFVLSSSSEGRRRLEIFAPRRDALAAAIDPERIVQQLEVLDDESLSLTIAAAHLARGAIDRRPDLAARVRTALAKLAHDTRTIDVMIGSPGAPPQRETLSLAAEAFSAQITLLASLPANVAVSALMDVLEEMQMMLDVPESAPDLEEAHAHARDIGRRFAELTTPETRQAAIVAIEARLDAVLEKPAHNIEALQAVVSVYRETAALAGGPEEAERMRVRLANVFFDRAARPGARYVAFQVLHSLGGKAVVDDDAVARFLDPSEDGALRALLGGIITIWRPDAFERIVDMNVQPWVVRHRDHEDLPANSLPANMPLSWLVATLRMAKHDEPHHRAVTELVTRMQPPRSRPWEWPKVRERFLEATRAHADEIRKSLRDVLDRKEQRNVVGRHAHAARLLALFGNEEDASALAEVAGKMWLDQAPPLDTVFWRPAGKAPAFGKYSFLEIYLEVSFGTEGRYKILADAYARAALRSEASGEGGNASRYAFEAFVLSPDDPKIKSLLDRLN